MKSSLKHRLEDNEMLDIQTSKKKCYDNDFDMQVLNKPDEGNASIDSSPPCGFAWYKNSCAYDSILSIIRAIWMCNRSLWTDYLKNLNNVHLKKIVKDFEKAQINLKTLNSVRDRLRQSLQKVSNDKFPLGGFASVSDVLDCILATGSVTVKTLLTSAQHDTSARYPHLQNTSCMITAGANNISSINNWMANFWEYSQHKCNICHDYLQMRNTICEVLPILAFHFAGQKPVINSTIMININTVRAAYILRGVIYFGDYHYTSRMINEVGMV